MFSNTKEKRSPVSYSMELVQKQYQGGIMVLIHGAYQSSTSFAFLKHLLPQYQFISLGWDVKGKFNQNLKEMRSILKGHAPLYFVGHSMGGIYAAHLSESVNCIGGTAVSVPWGGSKAADWMKYIVPRHQLYHEVATSSPIVVKARTMRLPGIWKNIVTTHGDNPGLKKPNDCVLSCDSMEARDDLPYAMLDATHHEALLRVDLIRSIEKNFLEAVEKEEKPDQRLPEQENMVAEDSLSFYGKIMGI